MAIANLQESLISYTLRKSDLQYEISKLWDMKNLYAMQSLDTNSLFSAGKNELIKKYKKLYENNPEYQAKYDSYRDMDDYIEELNKLEAHFQEQLEELSNCETEIDNSITQKDADMKEIEAYEEAMKAMLKSNIQGDFSFGVATGG